ncbi:GGDEF domain-containing protein [Chromatocurvus halotolerans]|uniref:diguanylate cyclase n=1 Tax=Chromatocurvus halotolerans TaxID=1132028 RepID=A0A4R2KYX4_9GAMM|nr:GGDEF domain-containing protein [Chromatocurvus halotolerans]TCO76629.1 diguanylate cyclase (GGDEF)-like protein [Chromatocurvus halotolerans]
MQVTDSTPHASLPEAEGSILNYTVKLSSTSDIKQLDRIFLEGACQLLPFDYVLLHLSSANGREMRLKRCWDRGSRSYQSNWQQDALTDEQRRLVEKARLSPEGAQATAGGNRQIAAFSRQNDRGNSVSLVVQYASSVSAERLVAFRAFKRIYFNFRSFIDESQRDPLTGLLNRRYFDDCIHRALEVIGSEKSPVVLDAPRRSTDTRQLRHWLAILDIDHFKRFNDAYGHLYGDEILLLFSRIMEQTFRESDLLFRFGGEEFVVIMENANPAEAMAALERFRMAIHAHRFPQGERVTVSCGAIEVAGSLSAASLLGKADEALYYAKAHGRNRTFMYEDLVASGELSEAIINHTAGQVELF